MITKYNAHINIEICSFILTIKYLYKYVYKGYNYITVIFFQSNNISNQQTSAQTKLFNEIKILLTFLTLNQNHMMEDHADSWHVTKNTHMEKNHINRQHVTWNINSKDHVDGWHVTENITAEDHGDGYHVTDIIVA